MMSTEPTKKKRSDAGKPRSNPAAKLAAVAMYVDVSIDVLQVMLDTSPTSDKDIIVITANLATLKAVKARLA